MIKGIKMVDVANKLVILRTDFNVPIKDGQVLDQTKIKNALPTIEYLLAQNAKVLIMSHFGKVKTLADKKSNSLKPVYDILHNLLPGVSFCEATSGEALKKAYDSTNYGKALLMENTRFEDLDNCRESNNALSLAKEWASLGEIFINDAFASSHREHASVYGIAKLMPCAMGLLMEKEITNLTYLLNPSRPFVVVMGGAKLDDKIALINALIPKVDYLLLGGGIANTFLKAKGYDVKESIVSDELLTEVKDLLINYEHKIVIPTDVIVGQKDNDTFIDKRFVSELKDNEIIYDLGNDTLKLYSNYINKAKTIFVNGTVGYYENEMFSNGTYLILDMIAEAKAESYVGGGDAVSAVTNLGFAQQMKFLSTGGGATLEFLAEGTLPGIEVLKEGRR